MSYSTVGGSMGLSSEWFECPYNMAAPKKLLDFMTYSQKPHSNISATSRDPHNGINTRSESPDAILEVDPTTLFGQTLRGCTVTWFTLSTQVNQESVIK